MKMMTDDEFNNAIQQKKMESISQRQTYSLVQLCTHSYFPSNDDADGVKILTTLLIIEMFIRYLVLVSIQMLATESHHCTVFEKDKFTIKIE